MSKAADLALGKIAALKTALIEFTDGDDAIAVADAGVVTLLTTAVAKSEGGAVTTNITQGLVKMWCLYKGTSTNAVVDSLNLTSVTDNSAGNYTFVIANNFAVRPASGGMTNRRKFFCYQDPTSVATGTITVDIDADDGSASDSAENSILSCGELA